MSRPKPRRAVVPNREHARRTTDKPIRDGFPVENTADPVAFSSTSPRPLPFSERGFQFPLGDPTTALRMMIHQPRRAMDGVREADHAEDQRVHPLGSSRLPSSSRPQRSHERFGHRVTAHEHRQRSHRGPVKTLIKKKKIDGIWTWHRVVLASDTAFAAAVGRSRALREAREAGGSGAGTHSRNSEPDAGGSTRLGRSATSIRGASTPGGQRSFVQAPRPLAPCPGSRTRVMHTPARPCQTPTRPHGDEARAERRERRTSSARSSAG